MIVSISRRRNVSTEPAVDDVLAGRVCRQAAVRNGDRQVELRLGGRLLERLVVEARLDEQVGAGAQQDRRQRHERDERDGEPRPDPAHASAAPQRTAL